MYLFGKKGELQIIFKDFIIYNVSPGDVFEMLKKKQPQPMTEKQTNEDFQASNGWQHRFCDRKKMGSVKLHGEIASADNEGAETYLDKLKDIIEQGGYSEDQIFNVDESGLFWKMPPTRTIMSKTKGQAPGMKLQKARCSILFGGNASGDLKLKPLLIHQFENLQNKGLQLLVYIVATTKNHKKNKLNSCLKIHF